jgi:hypothetical protein
MKTEYRTKDLYEAAYLVAKGLKLKRLERKPSSRRCFFVFDNLSECKTAVVDFWNCRGVVIPKSYAEAIRNLKDRLYAGV